MGLLDVNFNDGGELELIPDNTETKLRVTRSETTPGKSDPDATLLVLRLEDPSNNLVDDIYHRQVVPDPRTKEEDPKAYMKAVNRFRDLCVCFGVSIDGTLDSDDFVGATGDCIIRIEDDPQYGRKNSIKRFITGA